MKTKDMRIGMTVAKFAPTYHLEQEPEPLVVVSVGEYEPVRVVWSKDDEGPVEFEVVSDHGVRVQAQSSMVRKVATKTRLTHILVASHSPRDGWTIEALTPSQIEGPYREVAEARRALVERRHEASQRRHAIEREDDARMSIVKKRLRAVGIEAKVERSYGTPVVQMSLGMAEKIADVVDPKGKAE